VLKLELDPDPVVGSVVLQTPAVGASSPTSCATNRGGRLTRGRDGTPFPLLGSVTLNAQARDVKRDLSKPITSSRSAGWRRRTSMR